MANVGQWRASSVASNEPPAAPCKPDGPLRWLTKPSSDFWPTSSAGSGHIPDLKAFNRATLNFELQPGRFVGRFSPLGRFRFQNSPELHFAPANISDWAPKSWRTWEVKIRPWDDL